MRRLTVVVFLFFCLFAPIAAQDTEPALPLRPSWEVLVGGDVVGVFPSGPFGDIMSTNGIGYQGELWLQMKDKPLFTGLAFSELRFASAFTNYFEVVNGETVEFRDRSSSKSYQFTLMSRYMPALPVDFILPYLQVEFSRNRFYTVTSIEDVEFDEIIDRNIELRDWNWSYGGAVGFLIPVTRNYQYLIKGQVSYRHGTGVNFYRRDPSIENFNLPIEAFEQRNSTTDLVLLQIGLTINLSIADSEEEW